MPRPPLQPLHRLVAAAFPQVDDPAAAIVAGRVTVDGLVVTNPASRVRHNAGIRIDDGPAPLRGEAKLRAGLTHFGVRVDGAVALDVGAAAGGFTRVLLDAGARRVYACDAGHGQLLGSLRQDPRVVNLEATNVAALDRDLVPEPVEVVSIDVSYLSLCEAVAQLDRVDLAAGAELVGLVKPMFELRRATAPSEDTDVAEAAAAAVRGIEASGWIVSGWIPSPVTGARGAPEALLHARRPA